MVSGMDINEAGPEQPNYRDFFSLHEAALALHKGLEEVAAIDAQRGRWSWDMPYHVTQDRDRAAVTVRDAIRYLCSEEASD